MCHPAYDTYDVLARMHVGLSTGQIRLGVQTTSIAQQKKAIADEILNAFVYNLQLPNALHKLFNIEL